jgi:hypothetical protein
MIYLTTAESAVLEALGAGSWRTPTEIAEIPPAAALHVQFVRSALRELAVKRLVERGGWGNSMRWGEFRISGTGLERINASHQTAMEFTGSYERGLHEVMSENREGEDVA